MDEYKKLKKLNGCKKINKKLNRNKYTNKS